MLIRDAIPNLGMSVFVAKTIRDKEAEAKARFSEVFGRALRNARKDNSGPSQENFANSLGIDRTTISLIERGKQIPNVWTLYRMSKELEISAGELIAKVESELSE